MLNFHVIYDSERGALVLSYLPKSKSAVFQFSPAVNPTKVTQIKKGMKIYDYENSQFFSLSLPESATVVKLLSVDVKKDITIGSIQCRIDPKSSSKVIKIAHFPQKKDERTKDNLIISELTISVAANPFEGSTISYRKIQNKQIIVNISVRAGYPDYLALKLFLEKHSDFILYSHSKFMYERVVGKEVKNFQKTEEEYYENETVDEENSISEFQQVELASENIEEKDGTENFF
ncbi:MAG: hypothetical protein ABDI07_09990 [Candidatus Kryptonium sp.]